MEFSASFDVIDPILQISLIDLLLSGDNAILIAMACRSLPEDLRRKAVFLGTGAAVVFRVFMTFAATLALRAPYLKLLGALLLLLIAIELLAGDEAGGAASRRRAAEGRDSDAGIWRAVVLVVAADAVMSLDNVVAIAAAAQDNVWYLIFGLLLSVPILVFASLFVTRLLDAHPILVQGGAALLGWIAGKTAVADPAVAAALAAQSFGLVALAPVLGAAYVLVQGRLLREQRAGQSSRQGSSAAAQSPWRPRPAAQAAPAPAEAALPGAAPLPQIGPPEAAWSGEEAGAGAGSPSAQAPDGTPRVRKLSTMDLTIMAGVAVPALGLVATLIYIIVKAVGSR